MKVLTQTLSFIASFLYIFKSIFCKNIIILINIILVFLDKMYSYQK